MSSSFSANLNVMMTTARKAARSLLKDFGEVEHLQVSSKSAGDFVSKADIAAEAIIREELTSARPNYGILGEEGGETSGADPTRRWIVDPLDGTTNFLHGMPHWAISIALEHKGEITAGVILDPGSQRNDFIGVCHRRSLRRQSGIARVSETTGSLGPAMCGRASLGGCGP